MARHFHVPPSEIFPEGETQENRRKTFREIRNAEFGVRNEMKINFRQVRAVMVFTDPSGNISRRAFPRKSWENERCFVSQSAERQGKSETNRTNDFFALPKSLLSRRERRLLIATTGAESYRLIFWKYFQKPNPEKIVGKRMAKTRNWN